MLSNFLSWVRVGVANVGTGASVPPYAPYADAAINHIYHLLFCDQPLAFKPRAGARAAPWQLVLYAEPVAPAAVRALADDQTAEGRVRALAYNWLRANGHAVPARQLLGTIVEVPLDGGLDVLAAYTDGGVRYINQTGKLSVFEGPVPQLQPAVTRLIDASRAVVARIGPWGKERLPPPPMGNIRLTFLVSDGLYFGEGLMARFQRDPMAGPVIQHAGELLQRVVETATK